MRKELTDEWKARGIEKEKDYAILTNEMTKAWSGLTVKEYTGDLGPIPWSERSPGGGNGNPLQYSCLGNSLDRGAWQATVYRVTESDMT